MEAFPRLLGESAEDAAFQAVLEVAVDGEGDKALGIDEDRPMR